MARILVIDDEECIRFTFKGFLNAKGHEVVCAKDHDEAIAHLSDAEYDLVFIDIILQGKTGIDFLRECREHGISCPVIMITGYPDVETACGAMRLGAFDYITKPVEAEDLLRATNLALEFKRLTEEKERYRLHLDAILESVDDMIVTVDNNLVVTRINEAAQRLCGFTREAVGKDIRALDLRCMRSCLESLEQTIEKRQVLKAYRLECRDKENHARIINVSAYPLVYRPGEVMGAVMVVKDETRIARLEQNAGERKRLHNIIGGSPPMQKLYSLVTALADVDTTVLLTGESGTGKELFAEALHYLGPRREKPFVKVNCSALSESLLESELFGHVKGAFTGAVTDRVGRFQKADGGTIFLDEIGDLSPKIQSSLLRVLQNKEFERVGDSAPRRANVRIITATNKNLREKVTLGEFRKDLLYRLEVFELRLPPLRERRQDIDLLVEHYLEKFNSHLKKRISAISSDVRRLFMEHQWPGNIRELEHALEHAFVLCQQSTISTDYLPSHLQKTDHGGVSSPVGNARKPAVELESITEALRKTAWNKKKAARLLGIDRKTLYRNIKKYKLRSPDEIETEGSRGNVLRNAWTGS